MAFKSLCCLGLIANLLSACQMLPEPASGAADAAQDGGFFEPWGPLDQGTLGLAAPETSDVHLPLNGQTLEGTIDPAKDVDRFRLDLIKGQFVRVLVQRTFRSALDPVAQLIGPSGRLVAENDDIELGIFTSSQIVYRAEKTGTYTLQIFEWHHWSPEPDVPLGGEEYRYRASAHLIERGEAYGYASKLRLKADEERLVVGTFQSAGEVKVIQFEVEEQSTLQVELLPSGAHGHGSTVRPAGLEITKIDGQTLLARARLDEGDLARAAVPAGVYQARITHPGGSLGRNDFYVLRVESERFDWYAEPSGDNNTLERATALPALLDAQDRHVHVLGRLPDGDVDVFEFLQIANPPLGPWIWCGAERWGSGVEELTLEILSTEGQILEVDERPRTQGVSLQVRDLPLGRYYLRLSKLGQRPDNPTTFYFCEFIR